MVTLLEMRIINGDELRLRYVGDNNNPWACYGHVIKISDC